jgi:mRNA interferase RelE/StbE
MYEILIPLRVEKQLDKLERDIQERIINTLERIRIRPYHFVVRLVGIEGYKLKVGKYRVILDIDDDKLIVLVVEIGHRKNIYKK